MGRAFRVQDSLRKVSLGRERWATLQQNMNEAPAASTELPGMHYCARSVV